ncbi:MAG: 50S ribosomal protein L4, partial [Candidatus Dormiibacterota bacterium]
MATAVLRGPEGGKTGTLDLPEAAFGGEVHGAVLHQALLRQLAGARQGTHDTKTRAEVSGGGRKPYRQKGTGRARQGSIRAPQWRGGGTVFGPTPRGYRQGMPRKQRRLA